MSKIFIICSVLGADDDYIRMIERYAESLEAEGHQVYIPHLHTDQAATDVEIRKQNRAAIKEADEVHVFYNPVSRHVHFDMGMAFALDKPVVVAQNIHYGPGKSFARMLDEWAREAKGKGGPES